MDWSDKIKRRGAKAMTAFSFPSLLSWVVRVIAVATFVVGLYLLLLAAIEPAGDAVRAFMRSLLDVLPGVCGNLDDSSCKQPLDVAQMRTGVVVLTFFLIAVGTWALDAYVLARGVDPRERTREAFDAVELEAGMLGSSVMKLRTAAAERYAAEYDWYSNAANKRRIASWLIRASAVVLLGLGIIMLDLAALDPGGEVSKSMARWLLEFLPGVCTGLDSSACQQAVRVNNNHAALVATVLVAVAGVVLMYDRYMLIHRNFVAYRLTEFRLRSMQAEFLAEFDKAYLARRGLVNADDRVFAELKAFASRLYVTAANEIETETKAWGENLEQAIERLRTKTDSTAQSAKQAAEEAEEDAKPARLRVIIDQRHGKTKSFEIVIKNDAGNDLPPVEAKGGQTRGFRLPAGNWEVQLKENKEIVGTDVVTLAPGGDDTVTV